MDNNNSNNPSNIIQHALDFWIIPEVKKRQEKKEIPDPYPLHKALVIFYPDKNDINVLLNDEFQAKCQIKLKEGVQKDVGDPIFENDFDTIEAVELINKIDTNCGYFIFIRIGKYWKSFFDFRYNKGIARQHIITGDEFLSVAQYALENNYISAFIDNLYNSAELYVKAVFLSMRDQKIMKKSTHKLLQLRLNQFADQGNIEIEQKNTYNRLHGLRPLARYCKDAISITEEQAKDYFTQVKNLREYSARFAGFNKNMV